jgi:hypothetical protein
VLFEFVIIDVFIITYTVFTVSAHFTTSLK